MKASHSLLGSSSLISLNVERRKKHDDKSSRFGQIASRIYQFFYQISRGSEPRVWQKINSNGQITWFAYDPETSISKAFSSEQDVRIWLETRYYA
jgi:hypothetical protein